MLRTYSDPIGPRVVIALLAAVLLVPAAGADARAATRQHGAGPRLVRAELLAPGEKRVRLTFSRRVSFAGTPSGKRLLAIRGYRVVRIETTRNKLFVYASVRPLRSRATAGTVLLLRPRGGPWIRDRARRPAQPASVPLMRYDATARRTAPPTTTSTSSTAATTAAAPTAPDWHVLSNPIDPAQQSQLPF